MLTARAASRATVAREMSDWIIISTLAQRREDGRVGGRECGAGVEGQKEVVDEAGAPVSSHIARASGLSVICGNRNAPSSVSAAQLAGVRAAGVQPPVPRGEDDDVGDPERAAEVRSRSMGVILVGGQSGDEQAERPDHVGCDDGSEDVAEHLIEAMMAAPAGPHGWNGQDCDDGDEGPGGTGGKRLRQSETQRAHGKERRDRGPARLVAVGYFFRSGRCLSDGHVHNVHRAKRSAGAAGESGLSASIADTIKIRPSGAKAHPSAHSYGTTKVVPFQDVGWAKERPLGEGTMC